MSRFMESFIKDLEQAKQAIVKLFDEYDINFCFIGGVARNEYGSPRTTEDIDILVDGSDKEKVKQLPIGFIRDLSNGRGRVFSLHDPKTKVEVLYSGEDFAGNKEGVAYLPPNVISNKEHMIYLSDFVYYKLSAGLYGKRYKDYADIQDVIRINRLSLTYAKDNNFREDLVALYIDLWKETYLQEQFEVELMEDQQVYDREGTSWLVEPGDKVIIKRVDK